MLLTYVASQTMRVMDILVWVHRDYPLTGDVSFETAGGRLRQNILVRMRAGSFFRALLHPERDGLPDGRTSYTSESVGESTLDSWGSYRLPPVETLPILHLPLSLPLITDATGNIYGAQLPRDEWPGMVSDTMRVVGEDETSFMQTGMPLGKESVSLRRLDFRYLAPQDVWRWPVLGHQEAATCSPVMMSFDINSCLCGQHTMATDMISAFGPFLGMRVPLQREFCCHYAWRKTGGNVLLY